MIELLAIGYTVASIAQIVAGIPQIRKVIISENTTAISLTTWVMWGATQGLCLAYNISLADLALISVSMLWLIYYVAMVVVVSYYRWPQSFKVFHPVLRPERVPVEEAE